MIHRGRNVRAAGCGLGIGHLAMLALVLGVCMTPAFADTIFFAQNGAVDDVKAIDELGNQESVAGGIDNPTSVAVDERRRRIYWTEGTSIRYTGLFQTHPSPVIDLVTGLTDVTALTFRQNNGSVIYVDNGDIFWLRPNGTTLDVSQFIQNKTGQSTGTVEDICFHKKTLYWTDSANGRVASVTQAGPGTFNFVERATGVDPHGIACDSDRNRLYFTDVTSNRVQIVPMNGAALPTTLYAGLNNPLDVDVDSKSGRVAIANTASQKIVVVTPSGNMDEEHDATDNTFAVAFMGVGVPTELGEISPFGKPGSVVIWPYVNAQDDKTLITITNTNASHEYCGGGTPAIYEGTVRIKFLFVTADCGVQDRIITMSPNDTFSAFANDLNFFGEGWLLAAAVTAQDDPFRELIRYNYLIGSAQVYLTGDDNVWGYDAYTFRGLTGGDGAAMDGCGHYYTDSNVGFGGTFNNRIDFNDAEYDAFQLVNSVPRIVREEGDITNFLAVMNTSDFGQGPHDVEFTVFDFDEQSFSREIDDLQCLKFGSLVDEFGLNVVADLGTIPNPIPDPFDVDPFEHELTNSGWLQLWIDEVPEDDTPATLSVFALINGNPEFPGGNAAWSQPAAINRRQVTSFFSDLDNARPISDIVIDKSVDDETPSMGDTINYTVEVTNNGPADAEGVVIVDMLPAGVTYVGDTPSKGTYTEATGIWAIGDLANGETVTLMIECTVDGNNGDMIENCADLDSLDEAVSSDPDDDNKDCVTIVVTP